MNIKQKFKDEPIIISHHPACERFKEHRINIRGTDVCRGCLFVYPTLVITLILLNLLWVPSFLPFWGYMLLAFIFFSLNLLRKILHVKGSRSHNLSRISLGLAFGFSITSILKAPSITLTVIMIVIVLTIAIFYNVLNGINTLKICKTCPEYSIFPRCSGRYDASASHP